MGSVYHKTNMNVARVFLRFFDLTASIVPHSMFVVLDSGSLLTFL